MTLQEFADKYGLDSQEVLDILLFEKFPISSVDDELDHKIIDYLADFVGDDVKKNSSGSGARSSGRAFVKKEKGKRKEKKQQKEKEPSVVECEEITLGDLAKKIDVSVAQFVNYFIKKGKLYAATKKITIEELSELSSAFFFEIEDKKDFSCSVMTLSEAESLEGSKGKESALRVPIIAVVGHVDHGKTTLLDYIRSENVASGEHGGITQKIGAYKAKTAMGELVFIDTPGHQAFNVMRAHGLSAADIAVLVVAADDGLMEQTVEAIKMIQHKSMPVVVAITKIDKVDDSVRASKIDDIYRRLADYNLLVESWGGSVPVVQVSAAKGIGVDSLLESLSLVGDMLELKTSDSASAFGYVLEAHVDQGRGPVATIVLHQGSLKVGSAVHAGASYGKISALEVASGKKDIIRASEPCLISGFNSLPESGLGIFEVESVKKAREIAEAARFSQKSDSVAHSAKHSSKKNIYKVILKADSVAATKSLMSAVSRLQGKHFADVVVVSSSPLPVIAKDIVLAQETGATMYILSDKLYKIPSFSVERSDKKVDIRQHGIIYRLLEDIEEKLQKPKEPVFIEKKIGDGVVLKVFNIKGYGVVAGCRVLQGYVNSSSRVVVTRHGQRVGEGKILSLQKEKNIVKEVKKGYECAFLVEDFTDWQKDDKVDFFANVEQKDS